MHHFIHSQPFVYWIKCPNCAGVEETKGKYIESLLKELLPWRMETGVQITEYYNMIGALTEAFSRVVHNCDGKFNLCYLSAFRFNS